MIKTNPIDKEWKEEISTSKWWAVNYKGVLSEKELKIIPLRGKLLSFGGEEACLAIDDEDDEEHGNAVIETTVERVAYFGFIMNDEEAEEFCSWY